MNLYNIMKIVRMEKSIMHSRIDLGAKTIDQIQ